MKTLPAPWRALRCCSWNLWLPCGNAGRCEMKDVMAVFKAVVTKVLQPPKFADRVGPEPGGRKHVMPPACGAASCLGPA